jgi:hypothetical protein
MAPAGDARPPPAQITGGSQDKAAQMRVRSDDPRYLMHVDRWWNTLLPKVAHMTYQRGAGPRRAPAPIVLRAVLHRPVASRA